MKLLLLLTFLAIDAIKTQKLLSALTKQHSPTTGAEVIELLAQFYGGLDGIELKQSNEIIINGDISGDQNILMNGNNLGTISQTIYNIYKGNKRGKRKLRREIEVILRNANGLVADSNKRKLKTDDILDMIEDLVNTDKSMVNDAINWTSSPLEIEEEKVESETVSSSTAEKSSEIDEEHQSHVPFSPEITTCPKCQITNGQIDCRLSSVVCRHDQVCSLNMRSRGGQLVKVETQCKEPTTCAIEQNQNGNDNQWNQCRPQSGFHISSLCRQCCRGDCESKFSTLKTNWYRLKEWNTNLVN